MSERLTASMTIADEIKRVADDIYWCSRERYYVHHGDLLKGGNELVSLYARPTEVEAHEVARRMNEVIGPMRKKRTEELKLKLDDLLAKLMQVDY